MPVTRRIHGAAGRSPRSPLAEQDRKPSVFMVSPYIVVFNQGMMEAMIDYIGIIAEESRQNNAGQIDPSVYAFMCELQQYANYDGGNEPDDADSPVFMVCPFVTAFNQGMMETSVDFMQAVIGGASSVEGKINPRMFAWMRECQKHAEYPGRSGASLTGEGDRRDGAETPVFMVNPHVISLNEEMAHTLIDFISVDAQRQKKVGEDINSRIFAFMRELCKWTGYNGPGRISDD